MRYLRDYRLFESSDGLTDEQRKFLDDYTRGSWSVNREGLVDVRGNFWCLRQELEDFLGIRFGKVTGNFWYSVNQLRTLEGAPREVGGGFSCGGNQLRTLEGSPKVVGGSFDCNGNQLRTLEGAPRVVDGDFYCFVNQLKTLEGSPREVDGNFNCSGNPLISLEGAPEVIQGNFYFKNTLFRYNILSFLYWIDHIEPDEISLLLTHHFFTPQVIKEQIDQNPDFPYYVSLAWNTEGFKKTQEELKKILPENILVKIDDLWSIGGYL